MAAENGTPTGAEILASATLTLRTDGTCRVQTEGHSTLTNLIGMAQALLHQAAAKAHAADTAAMRAAQQKIQVVGAEMLPPTHKA